MGRSFSLDYPNQTGRWYPPRPAQDTDFPDALCQQHLSGYFHPYSNFRDKYSSSGKNPPPICNLYFKLGKVSLKLAGNRHLSEGANVVVVVVAAAEMTAASSSSYNIGVQHHFFVCPCVFVSSWKAGRRVRFFPTFRIKKFALTFCQLFRRLCCCFFSACCEGRRDWWLAIDEGLGNAEPANGTRIGNLMGNWW